VRCGGEKGDIGGVAAIDIGMGDAAHDREVVAVVLEEFEVRGEVVIFTGIFREERLVEQAQVVADAEEAVGMRVSA